MRPIITLEGGHEVNDVFLDNVKVPVENRIFQENQGWTCAKALLAHERSGIAGVARSKRGLERLREMADDRARPTTRGPLIDDTFFRRKLAELEIDLTALEFTELRTLAGESSGKGPGPEVLDPEDQGHRDPAAAHRTGAGGGRPLRRALSARRCRTTSARSGPDDAHGVAGAYFNTRKTSIYGGSNEIQRNIIAKMVLGL